MRRVVPVVIVLLLILGIGGTFAWKLYSSKYAPSTDYIDYAAQLGLGQDEYSVTLNHELLSDYRGVKLDGRVCLDKDLVTKLLNTRIYYDENENILIFTGPDSMQVFSPDSSDYSLRKWGEESSQSMDYAPLRTGGDGKLYIDAEFVCEHTQLEYAAFDDPDRIAIITSWGEQQVVIPRQETPVRYKGGVKSEVLRMTESSEKMYLIEAFDDWYNVCTYDGYIGWVSRKAMGEPVQMVTEEPSFDFPEYPSISREKKIILAWHQVMNTDANAGVTAALSSAPGINVLSPTWFYFSDTEGSIASTAGDDYVKACHEAGVEVWALFSNEFPTETDRLFDSSKTDEVLGYTSKRAKAIEQLMGYVLEKGIDGINLDFELISLDGADDYIEFVRELSIACRANGIVFSVDNYVPEYTPYYNRKEQGIVADYVVTMCYDETQAGSETPGPVASASFVNKGIMDTVAIVDKSKVIAAIPFFTRVWSTAPEGGVTSFACGMNEAAGYLTSHGVKPAYQESSGLNYGSYTSDKDHCLYEIWLQDEASVADEMSMIQSSGIAGAAVWKLGYESGPEIFELIKQAFK